MSFNMSCAESDEWTPEYSSTTHHSKWPGRYGGKTYFYWSGMSVPGMEFQPGYEDTGEARRIPTHMVRKQAAKPKVHCARQERFPYLQEEFIIRVRTAVLNQSLTNFGVMSLMFGRRHGRSGKILTGWLSGSKGLSYETADRLAEALGIPPPVWR